MNVDNRKVPAWGLTALARAAVGQDSVVGSVISSPVFSCPLVAVHPTVGEWPYESSEWIVRLGLRGSFGVGRGGAGAFGGAGGVAARCAADRWDRGQAAGTCFAAAEGWAD